MVRVRPDSLWGLASWLVLPLVPLASACGGSVDASRTHTFDSGPALTDATSPLDATAVVEASIANDAASSLSDSRPPLSDAAADAAESGLPCDVDLDASTILGDATVCPLGSVSFRMSVPPGTGLSQPVPWGCNWLRVSCGSAMPLAISRPNAVQIVADCRDCTTLPMPGDFGCVVSQVGDSGATVDEEWTGVYYTVGTCSSLPPQSNGCVMPHCAPAGTYVASMCACTPVADGGYPCQETCAQVVFDYPTSETVVGTLH